MRTKHRFALFISIVPQIAAVSTLSSSEPSEEDEQIIPTLLSAIDPETNKYVNALDDPLYEELQASSFHPNDNDWNHDIIEMESAMTFAKSDDWNPFTFLHVDKKIISFRDSLTISWPDTSFVGDEDVIALYCPAEETQYRNFRDALTVSQAKKMRSITMNSDKERFFGDNPSRLLRASKSIERKPLIFSYWEFRIPMFPIIREETCEFRLWKRTRDTDTQNPQHHYSLVSQTGPITIQNANTTPTGIHLSLTDSANKMRVHFATGLAGTPTVLYGETKLNSSVQKRLGESQTYTANDMCHSPANLTEAGKFVNPGMLHTVTLADLQPDTEYWYKVGIISNIRQKQDIQWSDTHTFITAPETGSFTSSPVSFIVYGDQGAPGVGWEGGYTQTTNRATREIIHNDARLVHIVGDLTYANGAGHVWDSWLDMLQPLSTQVPLMVVVGNHEYDYLEGGENGKDPSGTEHSYYVNSGSGGECGVPTAKRFPGSGNGNGVFWYSYDYGLVHTIVISSEHNFTIGSTQYHWIKKDMMSIDHSKTPWVIVESHRPMYNSKVGTGDDKNGIQMRNHLERIMRKYGQVDLFLAGHNHKYVRSCSGLYSSTCDKRGPMHVIVGTGGKVINNNDKSKMGPCKLSLDWMVSCFKMYGYGKVSVANATALHWEFVADESGAVMDDVWLYKD